MIITVTGSIGSGKSTVAAMLGEKGCNVIHVDEVGHAILNSYAQEKVLKRFGRGILLKSGFIDAKELADIVFEDRKDLLDLHKITHPLIREEIKKLIVRGKVNVIDAALYKEFDLHKISDKTIVVKCNKSLVYTRLKKKHTKHDIDRRARFQKAVEKTDFTIINNSSKKELKKKVEKIWQKIK